MSSRSLPGLRALRQLGAMLLTGGVALLGLLAITFAVARLLPSDPVLTVLGDRATPEQYQQTYRALRLDRPLAEQFVLYARDMLQGDFGTSLVSSNPIEQDLRRVFTATLELSSLAILLGLLGIPLAVCCVRWEGRWLDHLGRLVSLLGLSLPIFWLALVGLLVFYARLGWVAGPGRLDIAWQYSIPEVSGLVLVDTLLAGEPQAFLDALAHIVLPASLLGLVALGHILRMTRGFLLAQMHQDYVLVLRLKGLSEARILWDHALRNSAGPILALVIFTYALLLEGAVLVETVFAWPGLGQYIASSLFAADIPAVVAATLMVGIVYFALSLLAETLQRGLDPRTRRHP
ncbi:MAG: putative D,D-dipeptide transport system permease protein DdpB [Stenotrophomonas maltophilia]|nr:MAG: putative D,D-dipeptide transport system permease protein DdpB [Stenotrophomonas maltophilia]